MFWAQYILKAVNNQAVTFPLLLAAAIFAATHLGDSLFSLAYIAALAKALKLAELERGQKLHPFRLARLIDCGGDLKKRWYIEYNVFHVQRNQLVRKYDYTINEYKTEAERKAFASIRIKQINELLKSGLHIDLEKSRNTKIEDNLKTIEEALEYALALRNNAKRTMDSYSSEVRLFCKFLGKKKNYSILALEKKYIYQYIDHLSANGNAGKTINTKLGALRTMAFRLQKRGILKVEVLHLIGR